MVIAVILLNRVLSDGSVNWSHVIKKASNGLFNTIYFLHDFIHLIFHATELLFIVKGVSFLSHGKQDVSPPRI